MSLTLRHKKRKVASTDGGTPDERESLLNTPDYSSLITTETDTVEGFMAKFSVNMQQQYTSLLELDNPHQEDIQDPTSYVDMMAANIPKNKVKNSSKNH